MLHRAYIALGANLGDRLASLKAAAEALHRPGIGEVWRVSSVYESAPMYVTEQPAFLNAVLLLRSGLDPRELLATLLRVEVSLGRDRHGGHRFGPRALDLDLLLFDEVVCVSPELELPHPRMLERRFVLAPLVEIAPEVRHPITKRSARELEVICGDPDRPRIVVEPEGWWTPQRRGEMRQ